MNYKEKIAIPKMEGYECFACGTANPIGLNLQFYRLGDDICTEIRLGRYHVGWSDIAHGGIISTILDEVMSWTVIYFRRIFFVTRSIKIKYLRPVPLREPLTAKGALIEKENRRLCMAKGVIQDNDKNTLARGEATFAILPDKALPLVHRRLKKDMHELFKKLEFNES